MANRLRLRITGLDELRHAVKAYGQQLVASAVDAVTDAVQDTVSEAREAAPVKSGRLRDNIRGTVRTDGYSVTGTVRASATANGFPYPAVIEFGSERVDKKPFLVPTAIRNRKRLNGALRTAVVRHAPEGLGTPRITGEGPATPGLSID